MKSAAEHRTAAVAALTGLMVVVQIGWSGPAWAQGGALDSAFSGDGKVTTDFAKKVDLVQGVAVQADDKVVAVGWVNIGGAYRFGLARYNDDGSLDTTFGTGGRVTTAFGGFEDTASAVAIQPDGKIVVAGTTDSNGNLNYQFAVARYNADGTLDTSFGAGGKVTTAFFGTYNSAHAVVVQPDGRIVVAGFAGNSFAGLFDGRFGVARFNANGTLDTTGFGNGTGKVITDFGGTMSNATSVALQEDGKIVVAGVSNAGTSDDFAIARYGTDGTLDGTFGANGDGQVTTEFFGRQDFGQSVAVDEDGNIVVAGQAYGTNGIRTFALARYTSGGVLDTGFGVGGKVTTDFLGYGSFALAVVVDANGIVAAGGAQAKRSRVIQFAIARFNNADGSLDTTFGAGGKVTTAFSSAADVASALALYDNGDIVAAGQAQDKNFALARYLP